jgi:hypothetical protein
MKKVITVIAAATMLVTIVSPANAAPTKYSVDQKTLATFSSSATTLTSAQKAQVSAAVEANPNAEKFICTGIRYYSQPMSVNIMVRKRAKAACDYAKQLNPALSTWFQNKPTQARSYAGKVLLTIKSADVASIDMTLDSYESSLVGSKSQALVTAYLSKQTGKNEIEIRNGANVTQAESALQVSRMQDSLVFWSASYTRKVTVILYTGEDASWASEQLSAAGYQNSSLLQRLGPDGACMQSLAYLSPSGDYFAHCIRPTSSGVRESTIAAHEYAHQPLMTSYNNQRILSPTAVPSWANEGGAEFFAVALTSEGGGIGAKYFYQLHLSQLSSSKIAPNAGFNDYIGPTLATISSEEVVAMMRDLETRSASSDSAPYSLGMWATELLVAVYGVDAYIAYLDAMSPQSHWKVSFESTFGVSVDTFYEKLTPYLHWVAKTYG